MKRLEVELLSGNDNLNPGCCGDDLPAGVWTKFRQVLPGDPPDLDTLLDLIDSGLEDWSAGGDIHLSAFMTSLKAARHGEGGDT